MNNDQSIDGNCLVRNYGELHLSFLVCMWCVLCAAWYMSIAYVIWMTLVYYTNFSCTGPEEMHHCCSHQILFNVNTSTYSFQLRPPGNWNAIPVFTSSTYPNINSLKKNQASVFKRLLLLFCPSGVSSLIYIKHTYATVCICNEY